MEAFTEVTSAEAFMEAFMEVIEVSMDDMEDMKASTEETSTGAFTKASTKTSMEVMEAFNEVMEAFRKVPRKLS